MTMVGMIAYCGLICTECPAYVATQADDRQALETVAAEWRRQFSEPAITADTIVCDGCLGGGRLSGYCSTCEIRACAVERLGPLLPVNCAHCDDYACQKLDDFLGHVPEARALLDRISSSLA
jgi:hypothetical protein